jgi:hypothetical protein
MTVRILFTTRSSPDYTFPVSAACPHAILYKNTIPKELGWMPAGADF